MHQIYDGVHQKPFTERALKLILMSTHMARLLCRSIFLRNQQPARARDAELSVERAGGGRGTFAEEKKIQMTF